MTTTESFANNSTLRVIPATIPTGCTHHLPNTVKVILAQVQSKPQGEPRCSFKLGENHENYSNSICCCTASSLQPSDERQRVATRLLEISAVQQLHANFISDE